MEEDVIILDRELKNDLWKVPVSSGLIEDRRLSANEFRFYVLLMEHARQKMTCFPSRSLLAEKLGVSVRQIDRFKLKLKELGLLKWVQYKGQDGRVHNLYTLCAHKPIKKNGGQKKTEDKNVLSIETVKSFHGSQESPGNYTKSKNTKTNNKLSMEGVFDAILFSPTPKRIVCAAPGVQKIIQLWNGLGYPKARDADIKNLEVFPHANELQKHLPLVPFFNDEWWIKSNRNLSALLAKYPTFQAFCENFMYQDQLWDKFIQDLTVSLNEEDFESRGHYKRAVVEKYLAEHTVDCKNEEQTQPAGLKHGKEFQDEPKEAVVSPG